MAYTLVTVTNIVTASDYNNLQAEVAKLLGAGSGNRGYGQTMTSGQVAQSQTITAVHMNNLKTDLDKIAMHQTGAVAKTGPTLTGNDNANEVSDLGIVNAGNEILAGSTSEATAVTRAFNDYQQALENLRKPTTDPFRVAAGQFEVLTAAGGSNLEVSYSTNWNGTISHTITISFDNSSSQGVANMRHFFNAGGAFRFNVKFATTDTSTQPNKGTNWQGMLGNTFENGPGTVEFNAITTTHTGSSSTISNPNKGLWATAAETESYEIGSSNEEIFKKEGSSTYSANSYKIFARQSGHQMFFLVQFNDDNTGNPDEDVQGTLDSKLSLVRPLGSNVQVPVPTINMGTIS